MADSAPLSQIVLNDTLYRGCRFWMPFWGSESLFPFAVSQSSDGIVSVSCVQAWYYFTHQSDRWHLKALVGAVMLTDTIHQGLITHTVYTYTITNWGNVSFLGELVQTLLVEVLFNGLTTVMVQWRAPTPPVLNFLATRIWRLSDRKVWLIVIVLIRSYLTSKHRLRYKTVAELAHLEGLSLATNALAAAGDVVIAASLCTILHRSRTGFHRSDTIITKLIVFSVNTGLLTSLCALASLVSILAWPTTYIYIAFFFCIGRLYTNSLLATLNARKKIRELSDGIESTSGNNLSLNSMGKSKTGKISSSRGSGYIGAEPGYDSA
ncbi:uncharacterized protein LACBIDRAFT_335046 [Laccaria bicolor S238N-H82]|uniref:Predicted protein n=1 Tax=Laccaria bicolor (strain S238N-H82 / ATCC MYA-4686) TaxID=486041 RepID=B0E167_LACBS|nr:uncharacterized protein LACBIDRAFT_335046 [Laccaria bicolor S238N-H82]EDQ99405.1 predicted protein [Laccaria bicolor S238N-H82]|eukprot:XP_001889956.1 predicted protein [Laccaria bicolor S238N-H82]